MFKLGHYATLYDAVKTDEDEGSVKVKLNHEKEVILPGPTSV